MLFYTYYFFLEELKEKYNCRDPPGNLNERKFRLIGGFFMSYNKARAEKEWLKRKEATEIAKEINLTKDAIDKRISRLKKKI